MKLLDGILNTTLPKVSSDYILHESQLTLADKLNKRSVITSMYAELFEQLLLFNRVGITLGMNNASIAALVIGFGGFTELERALNLEAVEITLEMTMPVVGMGKFGKGRKDPSLLLGQPPVVIATHVQDGRYGDPEEAILDGLSYITGYDKAEKAAFARSIAPLIKIGPLDKADKAKDIVLDAYKVGALRDVGMPFTKEAEELDADSRIILQNLISSIIEMVFIAEKNYGLYDMPVVYQIAKSAIGTIEEAIHVKRSNDIILDTLYYPRLRNLYMTKKATITDAMKIRETNDGIEFIRWIAEVADPKEHEYVMRKYTEAVSTPKGFAVTPGGEILKGVVMQTLGGLTGGVIGGLVGQPYVGAIVGAGIGPTALKSGLELLSSLFLDKVAGAYYKGWTPKNFIDRIDTLSKKQ